MSECKYHQLLGAYHDGELDAVTALDVEAHVKTCPACSADLRAIGSLAGLIHQSEKGEGVRPQELRRMHEAISVVAAEGREAPLLRIAGGLAAMAASVLIISSVWLVELTGGPSSPTPGPVVVAPTAFPQPWEQVAMGQYVPPMQLDRERGFQPFEPALAYNDREFANDMFVGLSH